MLPSPRAVPARRNLTRPSLAYSAREAAGSRLGRRTQARAVRNMSWLSGKIQGPADGHIALRKPIDRRIEYPSGQPDGRSRSDADGREVVDAVGMDGQTRRREIHRA